MNAKSAPQALGLGLAALLTAAAAAGQGWNVALTAAWVAQSEDGSNASFRSQLNLDEGFLLEALELSHRGENGSEFELRGWGFGGAEPSQAAKVTWRAPSDWRFELEYRRTESFFQLAETELGLRRDDWDVTRWRAELTWDGWEPARLSLGLRYVERGGLITQPFRELRTLYLLGVDLDETRREASLRLETRTLPVKLIFEQSFGQLERRNDWFAAQPLNLDGDNPNFFVDAANDRREDHDLPISRLAAAWGNDRVEVTGALLWSPAELDVTGETSTTFGVDEDRIGRVQFADDLLGSASFDTLAGHLAVAVRLAPQWILRLRGDHRDRAQDAALLGAQVLRLTNAQGDFTEIPQPLDERTLFDVTDTSTRVEIEHRRERWSVWAGLADAGRDVDYRRTTDAPQVAVERDAEGVVLGVGWHLGRRLKASVEYEQDSFERFVFRTDPENVDRLTATLRASLARGWQLRLRGRFEDADNSAIDPGATDPNAAGGLDRSSDAFGLGAGWTSEDGKSDCGVDVDLADLTTETGLVFPDGSLGLSRYDLSLKTYAVYGRTERGRLRLSGSAQWLEDDGDTWPLESWNVRARLGFATTERTEVALFGQVWSYDETLAAGDDFEVTRYGVAFSWRTE